jgi:hypothetical protein
MRHIYLLILAILCLAVNPLQAQVSLTTPSGTYEQHFDGLASTGTVDFTTLPLGWLLRETGTGANTTYTADNGGLNSGNSYSYGATGQTERALGGLLSGSVTPTFGVSFTNNTGATITSLTITYTGEQWRCGATARVDRLDFQYSLNATDLATGAWTDVDQLDFASPNTAATGALNGNLGTNQTAITFTISGLTIPAGSTFFLRWNDFNATGADDGLAVDDFSLTWATGTTPGTTVSVAAGANAAEPSTDGSFTISLSSASATDITVTYNFTGTATQNADYNDPGAGDVVIPAGQLSVVVPIEVIDDALAEATETITINLTGATAPYTISNASASINLTSEDISTVNFTGNYFVNFNTLAASGTSAAVPTGWAFVETGSNADGLYAAGNGSSGTGNTYSFGTGTDPDRAFGLQRSGSLIPVMGALFTNNTGTTLTSLSITYVGEQWRLGTENRNDRLDFQFSSGTGSITGGTWTDIDGLDFIAPNSTGVGAYDGNAPANRRTINYIINGLSIPNGSIFGVRWQDFDVTGAEDGLAVDSFTISLGCTPPTNQATALNLTPALQSIAGSFTPAAAGTTPADDYLVLISTSPTLTELPVSGTTYAIDDVIGNATVVSIGNSTTFTASGLTPSTTYFIFVFSVSSATKCYNVLTPLTGNAATAQPPACIAPTTQASAFSANNITGTSADLSWTRGNGDNILVIARSGEPVNATVYNSIAYPAGTEIGSGNFVIYNGPAASFAYTGLAQNTTYHLALYEYSNTSTCYRTPALTGNFTTLCTNPVNVSALAATAGNAQAAINWTLPSAGCFDEIIVVASTASIAGTGDTYPSPANPAYTGGEQVVYRGTGTTVNVTGLTNGTLYYFKVFTRKGTSYSNGVQVTVIPFDPSSGYLYLYGNLHAHSSYSDGNQDDETKTPIDDFTFARDALCMDFLGISEHNHAGAGMSYPTFAQGYNEANTINGVTGPNGNSLVTLYGMEWGVISGGGHVLVYGFDDKLVGWEPGNFDIFVAKNDYAALWNAVNARSGAFATLAHPNSGDYSNLASGYNAIADAAIVGQAVESGPASSTSTTYNDFPSSLSFLSYYRTMLSRGYRLAPQMDQDNHKMTFGTSNSNRMVVLSPAKSREALMESIRSMRYYASQDCNMRIDFKNGGTHPMGSQVSSAGVPQLSMVVTDLDGEAVTTIQLWGGEVGGSVPATPVKTYTTSSFTFSASDIENIQPNNTTWYYYAIVTQEDGNRAVTSAIWYTRNDMTLPVTLTTFRAKYDESSNKVNLTWTTAQESNSKEFIVERSNDGVNFTAIGNVKAAGNSNRPINYTFADAQPFAGNNYYRLQQIDFDGRRATTGIVKVTIGQNFYLTYGPNPATESLTINIQNNHAPLLIQLTDLNGRLLQQRNLPAANNQTVRLPVNNLAKGVYLLKIAGSDMTKTEKIIVK